MLCRHCEHNVVVVSFFSLLVLAVLAIVGIQGGFVIGIQALVYAFIISLVVNILVKRFGFLAVPVERSSHTIPTPVGGGIGIFLAISLIVSIYAFVGFDWDRFHQTKDLILLNKSMSLLCLALGMAIMGLIDDRYHLRWLTRICLQLVFSFIFLFYEPLRFLEVIYIPFIGVVNLGGFQWILAVLWMVGFCNLYNFMDGLNGLVSGYTVVALLGIIGVIGLQNFVGLGIVVIIGALLGFLVHNFPRAKLFLGDCGSQFLGFLIAGLALIIPASSNDRLPLLAMPLLFWPFINDGLWTFGRRIYFQRPIYDSHRDYLFHLLHQMGYSHTHISALYIAFAFIQVGWLYILRQLDYTYHLLLFFPNIVMYGIYGYVVVRAARSKGIQV